MLLQCGHQLKTKSRKTTDPLVEEKANSLSVRPSGVMILSLKSFASAGEPSVVFDPDGRGAGGIERR
jgi:hypothetical protein